MSASQDHLKPGASVAVQSAVWHPCTQMKDHEWLPLINIESGSGVWLIDDNGNRYIDAISSWWVNLFGHANPLINRAIREQLDTLEQVMLAGFTHPNAIELSNRLVEITPQGLSRVFFADNGSCAVEVALKMSFHYWQNCGQPDKQRFINVSNSYHGETIGALSVGDVELYKKVYAPLLLDVITAPSPDAYLCEPGQSPEQRAEWAIEQMAVLLETHAHETCAVIIEPLVQGAGSLRMYHHSYLSKLRKLCNRYDVHLIADEIAVGFGRTGKMFACEHAAISPDFLCLSKGITGGYLPLSVVMTSDRIYNAFYDDYETMNAFMHSHSYAGNPLACAAALATLDIFKNENILDKNKLLIEFMRESTKDFIEHEHISDVRQCGMILAIEIADDKKNRVAYDWKERRGMKVYQHGLENGVILRPMGNVIYFMPPYVINEEQLAHVVEVAWQGIQLATCN